MKIALIPILGLCILMLAPSINAQLTLIEKLGYTQDDKLLIVHADDLGSAHSENRASFPFYLTFRSGLKVQYFCIFCHLTFAPLLNKRTQ